MELMNARPDVALVPYLVGRRLYNAGAYEAALPYLEQASRLGLPHRAGLAVENERLRADALLRAGHYEEAVQTFEALAKSPRAGEGLRARARDAAERARFLMAWRDPDTPEAP